MRMCFSICSHFSGNNPSFQFPFPFGYIILFEMILSRLFEDENPSISMSMTS